MKVNDFLDCVGRDLRYALRSLPRRPAFTVAAVLTLALGIGATTAIFSVVNAVLLRPLPYVDSHRIVRIVENVPGDESVGRPAIRSSFMFQDDFVWWRTNSRTLSYIAASTPDSRTLRASEGTVRLNGARVSQALFPLRGVAPVLGRWLLTDEERPDADVVVLSESTWRRHFAADENLVGSTLSLDGRIYTVVGVMPEAFGAEDFWTPFVPAPPQPGAFIAVSVSARLRNGVSIDAAMAEVQLLGSQLRAAQASSDGRPRFELVPELQEATERVAPALRVLIVAVSLVLLIVCTNVANLLLARGMGRQQEIAVRRALGATRGRIVNQLLTESLVLAIWGGAAGLVLAYGGVALVKAMAGIELPDRYALPLGPAILPRLDELSIDLSAFMFVAWLSVVAAVLFGLWPALRLSQFAQPGAKGSSAMRNTRTGRTLGATQLALATTLLVAAALLMQSFVKLTTVDIGFNPRDALSFELVMPAEYGGRRKLQIAEQLVDRLSADSRITSVGFTDVPPLQPGISVSRDFTPQGMSRDLIEEEEDRALELRTQVRYVSSAYLQALGAQLTSGRWFTGDDSVAAGMTVLVSQQFVNRFFPNGNALGSSIDMKLPFGTVTIVGVVDDLHLRGLESRPERAIYIEPRQVIDALQVRRTPTWDAEGALVTVARLSFALRSTGDPLALTSDLRAIATQVDSGIAVEDVTLMEEIVAGLTTRPRFYALLFSVFGALSGLIAIVGIYGVLSYFVSQRTKEIGIRMALGAQRGAVRQLVLRQGGLMVAAGITAGLVGAVGLTRYLEGMLFGLATLDATTYVVVAIAFAAIALIAVYVPARRATTLDPLIALRHE